MSSKISLWAAAIGMGVTVTILQPIAIAKSSVEVVDSTHPTVFSIARTRRRGSGGYFASAARKYQQGNFQGALADYTQAIEINPRNANAYYNRGLLKATKLQDEQGALADYNSAIQIRPSYDAAYNNRGNLKTDSLQDYQGALADYNRAIQLKPRNAEAYFNRGVLKYSYLKNLAGGIADLQKSVRLSQKQGNTQDAQSASDLLRQLQQTSGK
jgi:tetratricopeptide (TPR) repeat protein